MKTDVSGGGRGMVQSSIGVMNMIWFVIGILIGSVFTAAFLALFFAGKDK